MTVGGNVATGGDDGTGGSNGQTQDPAQKQPSTTPNVRPAGASVSDQVADHEKEGVSRGTIGAGTITIRDPAHQSQDVASINRDSSQAQVVTKDTSSGVKFYGSTSSVQEIASGFKGIRQGAEQIGQAARDGFKDLPAQVQAAVKEVGDKVGLAGRTLRDAIDAMVDAFVARGDIAADDADTVKTLALRGALSDTDYAALKSCDGGKGGFNLHDLLFTRAYADATTTMSGGSIANACAKLGPKALWIARGIGGTVSGVGQTLIISNNSNLDAGAGGAAEDGTNVIISGKTDELDRTMTVSTPDGTVYTLKFQHVGTNYVLIGGTMQSADGETSTLNSNDAYDAASAGAKVLNITVTTSGAPQQNKHLSNDESDERTGTDVNIGSKVIDQLADRKWTDEDIRDVVAQGPTVTTTDDRSASKTEDGVKRSDPATVYGKRPGGYVVVNDRTNEVVQVGGRNDPNWVPDSRIKWY